MNVNSLIINTLSPLVPDVVPNKYTGTATTYIVFNCEDDRGEVFADNMPITDVVYLMIHLFCPMSFNYHTLKKQIRSRLFKAGFSYPTIQIFYEEDTQMNHIVFQCEIEGNSETEE